MLNTSPSVTLAKFARPNNTFSVNTADRRGKKSFTKIIISDKGCCIKENHQCFVFAKNSTTSNWIIQTFVSTPIIIWCYGGRTQTNSCYYCKRLRYYKQQKHWNEGSLCNTLYLQDTYLLFFSILMPRTYPSLSLPIILSTFPNFIHLENSIPLLT